MKSWMLILSCSAAMLLSITAQARDTQLMLKIEDAMARADGKAKLDGDIKFFFGDQKTPKVKSRLGEDSTNKKTNAFNKSDEEACQWAFLSGMIALKEKAQKLGANAVINIRSNYNRNEMSSTTEYECHAGGIMAGVALKGTYVKLAQ